jgi:hypothetical protein
MADIESHSLEHFWFVISQVAKKFLALHRPVLEVYANRSYPKLLGILRLKLCMHFCLSHAR